MIELRPFDPDAASPEAWSALHAFRRARDAEDATGDPVADDAEFERQLRHRWPLYESRRWHAWTGGDIVGGGGASFRREGTPGCEDYAPHLFAWGGVREGWRRRGVGTALLRPLVGLMRERGKAVATFGTSQPSGDAFLIALGAAAKHRWIENRAPFAVLDWAMLERWRGAAAAQGGLRWEVHPRRVPRERMEPLVPQLNALMADVPHGAVDGPPLRYELAAWLASYEEFDRSGGEHAMVLLTDAGHVAAVCEAVWDPRHPDRVDQQLTAVAPSWRGRGLAKAVKAAMLLLVRERHPEVRLAATSNAEVNAPMLAINARLGFAEHRRGTTYQIGAEALAAAVDRRRAAP